MEAEALALELEVGDHISRPINPGTTREVKQLHARAYLPIGHPEVPVATRTADALAAEVCKLASQYSGLAEWRPTEAGYQLYRSTDDWISPHRDRRSDELLAVTITVTGTARVRIHEPLADPDDYTRTRVVHEFRTLPGSVMMLRAPGLGSGEQTIHEVLPPLLGSRLVLNLRMRPDILEAPGN